MALREHGVSPCEVIRGRDLDGTSGSIATRSSGRPSTSTYCGGTWTVQPSVSSTTCVRVAVVVRAAAGGLADDSSPRRSVDLGGEVACRGERHAPRQAARCRPRPVHDSGSLSASSSGAYAVLSPPGLSRTSTITRLTFGLRARVRGDFAANGSVGSSCASTPRRRHVRAPASRTTGSGAGCEAREESARPAVEAAPRRAG